MGGQNSGNIFGADQDVDGDMIPDCEDLDICVPDEQAVSRPTSKPSIVLDAHRASYYGPGIPPGGESTHMLRRLSAAGSASSAQLAEFSRRSSPYEDAASPPRGAYAPAPAPAPVTSLSVDGGPPIAM